MRKLIWWLLGLVAVILIAAAVSVAYVRTSLPDRNDTVAVAGLHAPVDVTWDEYAIPRIQAASIEDAAFAQGYVHAQDRLWQMELVRRAVQGRLAEVLGQPGLETDRFMRRLGLWNAAVAGEKLLNDRERRLLQAYADGVNAALDSWKGALPPEFLLLGYKPEPWRPAHTLAVAKMMSFTLASYGEAVGVARAVRRLGPDRARFLFPAFPDWGATILEPPAPPDTPPLAAALVDAFSVAAASNSWAVSGRLTRSGRPILANDPHLELQAPSIWYLVGLHAPAATPGGSPLDVVGVSLPGAPLVIIGHNRAIAWGMTNAYVDDTDLFIERVDSADPGRYLVPGGSEPFRIRTDTIWVKDREEPVIQETRITRHGPVLPLGDEAASGDTVLAVSWTALRPSTVFRGVMEYNLARSWDEFLQAADDMDDPHQNLVYADSAGHIGYVMGGTVPVRGQGRPATVVPRPGWTGEWDWTGTLPFARHPRVLDPAAGYVVTANNRQTVEPIADRISRTWNQPFRAMRITQMIRERGGDYDAEDIHAMQMDVLDLYATRYLDRAVEAAEAAGLEDAAHELRGWDGVADAGSTVAPVFYAWNELVRRAVARDLYGGRPGWFPREVSGDVLEQRAVPWADDPVKAYREITVLAMRDAVALARGRTWAESNRVLQSHALGSVDILERVAHLNIGPDPHYGSPTTVNVAHWAFTTPDADFPFTTTAGPSMRMVADFGNLDGAGGFVIATGQSGLPFSRHYRDQYPRWQQGGLIPVPVGPPAPGHAPAATLRLDPNGNG